MAAPKRSPPREKAPRQKILWIKFWQKYFRKHFLKHWRRGAYWIAVLGAWGLLALALLALYIALTLPPIERQTAWDVQPTPDVAVFSVQGELLARRGGQGGQQVGFDDLPPHLIDAVLAIEDRRFFSHFGVDLRGLARATFANLAAGRLVQGGSTLTQQLAKNLFLTPERTLRRKLQEILLAFWLETRLSKQEILTLYLNRVYFGDGLYGIGAAADNYFGKSVQEVDLAEAALLAGLLKAPSRYAPTRNAAAAATRRRLVLTAMHGSGKISRGEAAAANRQNLFQTPRPKTRSRYAVDWVQDILPDFIGRPRGDLQVLTTLDANMQRAAQEAISAVMGAGNGPQAAMVVMTPYGAVRAMVGGRDYAASQYNRAVWSRRQPGSAFKPVVYLAALEAGRKAEDELVDAPIAIDGWSPRNYDNTYRGRLDLRDALAFSVNTVAVQLSEQIGRGAVIELARRLGIATPLRPHPSLALGSFEVTLLELTALYAHFANGGRAILPHVIDVVRGSQGEAVYVRLPSPPPQVVAKRHIRQLNDMLTYALAEGTGKAAKIEGLALAGKTGTSQNWRDAWFVGYSGALVVGVWVGNDDGSPMPRIAGSGLPAQIWKAFMQSQYQANVSAALPQTSQTRTRRGFFRRLFGN